MMKAHILCDQGVVRFNVGNNGPHNGDAILKLSDGSVPLQFRACQRQVIKPSEKVFLTCTVGKAAITGSYSVSPTVGSDQTALSQIVDMQKDDLI